MNFKKIEEHIKLILTIISLITVLWGCFRFYNSMTTNFEEIQIELKSIDQRSLKSLIWNKEIPLIERIDACDVYIHLGFNSYTKKYCEKLLHE